MRVYEYPGNELIRVALKFEHLYQKAKFFGEESNPQCSQEAVLTFAELITLTDRVDLRNMLTRELSRHLANLRRLSETPQVDHSKLQQVLTELEHVVTKLHRNKGLFAKEVFENYFIQTVRRQNGPPGSGCAYNMPELHAWLQQNAANRMQQCQLWLSYFNELNHINHFLLQLARESMHPKTVVAPSGMYQETIQHPGLCQLIRVWAPQHLGAFPKFSLSQHKLNVRFLNSHINSKHEQVSDPIEFNIAVCSF